MGTGIIFEGGGMRGIFTSGVIDLLIDKDIMVDNVIGVSAGATNAVSYVTGQRERAYAATTDYMDDPEFAGFKNLRKTGDYFNPEFVFHRIPDELYPVDQDRFRQRGMKFQVVMTNCITGEAEYPEIRDLHKDAEYIRASATLPLISRMVPLDGYVYLDGGLTDSIPVRQSVLQGNEKNIVVLTRDRAYRKKKDRKVMPFIKARYRNYPKVVEALENRARVYNETLDYIEQGERDGSIFVIAPMGPLAIGRTEMDRVKLKKAYEEGYFVAEGLCDKLMDFLNN